MCCPSVKCKQSLTKYIVCLNAIYIHVIYSSLHDLWICKPRIIKHFEKHLEKLEANEKIKLKSYSSKLMLTLNSGSLQSSK